MSIFQTTYFGPAWRVHTFMTLAILSMSAWATDVRVNDRLGRDGTQIQPTCCGVDPDTCSAQELLSCCYQRESKCVGGGNHGDGCTSDGECANGFCTGRLCADDGEPCLIDADCATGLCLDCDDDPLRQNEPAIAVAPWDSDLLVAAYNDWSTNYEGVGSRSIGFAFSDDGGLNWYRFDPNQDDCDLDCDPEVDCFASGSSLTRADIPCSGFAWLPTVGDPAVAFGGATERYVYLTGVNQSSTTTESFFARLKWPQPGALFDSGWEIATVPPGGGDKTYMNAGPLSDDVYVYWGPTRINLSASRSAGDDFLIPPPQGDPMHGLQISFGPGSSGNIGSIGAVDNSGRFHIAWLQVGGGNPGQIRYRRGEWNETTGILDFTPDLPEVTTCVEDETCALPLVEGGFIGLAGIFTFSSSLVQLSLNLNTMTSFPGLAIDRNDPVDFCTREGTVYATYTAEEPVGAGQSQNPGVCDTDRTVDSNVYVVRSFDGGDTWQPPVNVMENVADPVSVLCDLNTPNLGVPCGNHVPLQFLSWIATDDDGRVAVVYYDTTIDSNRCDANTIYEAKVMYSLDGGAT